ncbi:agmatine deiminase family protein [Caenimonas sedimenti]|nr:agmatine deiminase family protein [Caenimonas sedimenti]
MALPLNAAADGPQTEGARLTADFDPIGAMWLGYDAGHEAFTGDLAQALWPHVPIRMLVRDPQARVRAMALLADRGLDAGKVQFTEDRSAHFFVRDSAVFGVDGDGRPFIVDFRWTGYGLGNWCRRRHGTNTVEAAACAATLDRDAGAVDERLAEALRLPRFTTSLAMEGGGVEVNGQGLLIAHTALWRRRNGGMARDALEAQMLALPGIRKVIWIPFGLAHDAPHRATITGPYVGWGTGGHTDEFVRFADENTVLLAWVDEAEANLHPVARLNRERMQANLEVLRASTDQRGRPLRVVKVPLPRVVERPVVLRADADTAYSEQWSATTFPPAEGRREGDTVLQVATTSYLNHVVANGLVLLPDYVPHGTPPALQERVLRRYEAAFPGRTIRFIDCMGANWVGAGAHCASLGQPRARPGWG